MESDFKEKLNKKKDLEKKTGVAKEFVNRSLAFRRAKK
jgi:hypothetical protein